MHSMLYTYCVWVNVYTCNGVKTMAYKVRPMASVRKCTDYFAIKNAFVLHHLSQRVLLQQMIEMGLVKYVESKGDTSLLTDTIRACEQLKASQTNTVQKYIMVHANVLLKRDKELKLNFRKVKVKVDGKLVKQEAIVTWPKYTYWEHDVSRGDKADTTWSADKYASQVLSKLRKESAGIIQAKVILGVIQGYITEKEKSEELMKAIGMGRDAVMRLEG